ncbi:MAG TPA: ABC transporter substrate-binding protein [Chloroflexota bacterium]|nr:ABC transporter substrate-binding protein [Chloroflexota bacterium]
MPWRRQLLVGLLICALAGCTASDAGAPLGSVAPGAATATEAAPAGRGPATQAPAPVALRFGLNTVTANLAALWVAKDEGFFLKYGLDPDLVPIPGAERIIGALVAGEVPITTLAPTSALNAALHDIQIQFIGAYSNKLRFWLYAQPDIASVPDLRGKQVAVTGRAGIVQRTTAMIFERYGLDVDRDTTLIATGDMGNSLQALLSGGVSAGLLSPPGTFRAEDAGLRQLVDTTDWGLPGLSGVAARREWIAANEPLARGAVQALAEGLAFLHRDKEGTKQIIAKYTQNDDPALLERTYVAMVPGWERYPYVSLDAVRTEIDWLAEEVPAAADLRAEQFVDNHFVEDLDRAGFLQRLYQ